MSDLKKAVLALPDTEQKPGPVLSTYRLMRIVNLAVLVNRLLSGVTFVVCVIGGLALATWVIYGYTLGESLVYMFTEPTPSNGLAFAVAMVVGAVGKAYENKKVFITGLLYYVAHLVVIVLSTLAFGEPEIGGWLFHALAALTVIIHWQWAIDGRPQYGKLD